MTDHSEDTIMLENKLAPNVGFHVRDISLCKPTNTKNANALLYSCVCVG